MLFYTSSSFDILGADNRILLWDIGEAAPLADLKGHTSSVNSLCFSREGHVLASGTKLVKNNTRLRKYRLNVYSRLKILVTNKKFRYFQPSFLADMLSL